MMMHRTKNDERSEYISGKIANIFLGFTQAGLFFLIVYQRYILERSPDYYNDLLIVFGFSVIGYWTISLFLGGIFPVLSIRSILGTYLFLVLMIGVPHLIIRGFPDGEEIIRWILIVFGGPAVMVGGYSLAAALGKRRINRLMDE